MSTEGAPVERGQPRRFTDADVKTLAYVRHHTDRGATHDAVAEQLASGALDGWEWAEEDTGAPRDDDSIAQDVATGHSALILAQRLGEVQARLQDEQARSAAQEEKLAMLQVEAREREQRLQEQINQLLRDLGHREGELDALRASKPKGFWSRLLGRGE